MTSTTSRTDDIEMLEVPARPFAQGFLPNQDQASMQAVAAMPVAQAVYSGRNEVEGPPQSYETTVHGDLTNQSSNTAGLDQSGGIAQSSGCGEAERSRGHPIGDDPSHLFDLVG